MSGMIRRLTGSWRRPRSLIIVAAIAVFSAGGLVAWAAWSSQGNGPGAAKSLSMPGGNTPTASVSGTTVTVGWSASVFANGVAVQGYRVRRYAEGSTTAITPGADCGGTITALTCAENAVPGGSWQYTVTPYQGNWIGAESGKSPPITVSTGGPIATTTAVHSSGTPSVFGQLVTFTATVSPAPPAGETVSFTDGATSLGGATLNTSGSATVSTGALAVGSHTISASYAGDSSFVGSSGTTVQVVNKASTTVAVTSSDNSAVFGESVSFTATVTAVAPGAGTADGTVQFTVDGVNFGAAVSLAGGSATSDATNTLSVGNHTVTAVYSGSTNFNGATGTLSQAIGKANTTTALTSAPNPSVFGQMVTFTATVSAVAPGAGTPGGASVTFTDGTTTLGTASLSGGSATFITSALSVGSHTIGASYAGDTNFNGSTAAPITQVVGKADTTTVVTSSLNPSVFGQGVSFTATIAAVPPGAGSPSGTVQFRIDGSNFGSPVALLGNKAFSDSASALSVGSHTVTATYGGDTNFNGSTSAGITQTVTQADAATVVTASSPNPSVFGQAVTFSATVSAIPPGAGTPTGNVQFSVGLVNLGGPVTLSGGTATSQAISSLPVGTSAIVASYSGDANFMGSTSPSFTQTVNKDGTTTSVTSSANPSVFGQSVTFTATVSANAPGSGTPTGTVTFSDGTTTLGTGTLSGGAATFTTATLSVGNHSITASYGGDSNFLSSASSALQQVGNQAPTTTTLTSSSNPSVFGQPVTFTATVTVNAPGSGTPTGSVTFADGVNSLGSGTLSGGTATLQTSAMAVATHTITATYNGDGNFAASSTTLTQTVNRADSMTTLSASPTSAVSGQIITFTPTTTAVAPGAGTPTGLWWLWDGSTVVTGGSVNFALNIGLTVGTHSLTAHWDGDGNFNGSISSPVVVTVTQASSTTTVTASSANPSVFGQSVTFTATVSAMPPGGGTPTGSVQFFVGGANLGSAVALIGGTATSPAISSLPVGSSSISAAYGGDTNFTGSVSSSFTQTVNKDATTTAVVSSANPSLFGQSVTFTATVSANSPGAGTPSGTVTFSEGTTTLGTGTLSGGSAGFTTSTLSVGNHTITASYGGDGNFLTSDGSVLQAVGNQVPTTTMLTSSANPSVWGQPVTFTASVTVNPPGSGTPTGTLTFSDGTTTLGSGTLGAGTATFMTAGLPVAGHTIAAAYSGDGNFASSSGTLAQTVNRADTTSSLDVSPTSSVYGQPVTVTVTVSVVAPGAGSPASFSIIADGATDIQAGPTNSPFGIPVLSPGTHSLTGRYHGDGNLNPSTSAAVILTVSQASTSTTLGSSPNPSVSGQNVTFTAAVAVTSPGSGTPTGTVTFSEGATTLGTGSVNSSGQATYSTSTLTVGSHIVTASYGGDTNFTGSASTSVTQVVTKVNTTTTIASSNNPSVAGQSVTFTATVAAVAPGTGTPTGTVDFADGTTSLGSVTLDSTGNASITTSTLSAGTHTITGTYNGDANFNSSQGSLAQAVNSGTATTTTTLSATTATPEYGQMITFTALVSSAGGTPTGTVTFRDGGTLLVTNTLDVSGHTGFFTFRLGLGAHSVTATYAGDTQFSGSTSNTLAFTVSGSCTINWSATATTNLWSTPANWDLNRVPGATDHVCIRETNPAIMIDYDASAGTTPVLSLVTFSGFAMDGGELGLTDTTEGSYIDNDFRQAAGTLSGAANLTMNVSASWWGGNWSGTGTTTFSGGTFDAIFGYVTLNGTRTVDNHGTVTHSYSGVNGGGQIVGDNYSGGATIANAGNWTEDSSNGALLYNGGCCGAATAINNTGSLTLMGGNQIQIFWALNNTGTLTSAAGNSTATYGGGGTPAASAGVSYSIAGTFEVGGGAFNIAAGNLSGNGTLKVTGGSALTLGTNAGSTVSYLNVAGGGLLVNGTDSALNLTMTSGGVGGTGTLTLNQPAGSGDALTVTGGAMQDAGNTIVPSGSTGRITGYETFNGNHVLTNHGTMTHFYTAGIGGYVQGDQYAPGAGTIVNTGNWTEDTSNGALQYSGNCCGATMAFNNSGTLTQMGSGQTAMYWALTNTGAINVDAGTLMAIGGGGTPASSLGVSYSIAGIFEVAGGTFNVAAGDLSGNGTLKVSGGLLSLGTSSVSTASNVNVTGGTLDVFGNDSALSLTQSGGTLGGTGTLTLTQATAAGDALTWSGGTMQDAGTTMIAGGSTGTISGYEFFSGNRILSNHGTVTHKVAGSYIQGDSYPPGGGTILNSGSWTEDSTGGTLYYAGNCCGATMAFTNSGTLTQTGGGQVYMDWTLTNTGTLNAAAGTLTSRGGGGTPSGSAGATYTVSGTFEVAGGTFDVAAGNLSGSGTIKVSYGTLTLGTSSTSTASHLNVTGGVLQVNGTDSALSLALGGGTLGGTGTLTLTQPSSGGEALTWIAGTMQDAGNTIVASGSTGSITGNSNSLIGNRILTNHGAVTHNGGSYLQGDNYSPGGGTIVNTGSWTIDSGGGTVYYLGNCCGAAMAFNNSGTLIHKGTGQTNMYWTLTNTRAVSVDAGTLTTLGGGGTPVATVGATYSIAGTFEVAAGAFNVAAGDLSGTGTIKASGGTLTLGTSSTSTASHILLTGGTLNVNGTDSALSLAMLGGTLGGTGLLTVNQPQLSGDALTWTGGTMLDAGTTIVASGSRGTVGGSVSLGGGHTLTNLGAITQGAGSIYGDNYPPASGTSGGIVNSGTWTNDTSAGTIYDYGNCCGATMAFDNRGTLTHMGAGQTNMYWTLTNTGTLNLAAGTLTARGGGGTAPGSPGASYSISGTFEVAGGPDFNVAAGNLSGSGTIKVSAGGMTLGTSSTSTASNISLVGGTLMVDGTDSALSLNETGGTLAGVGTLALNQPTASGNALTWTGGGMTGSGNTIVASGSTGTVGGYVTFSSNRMLTNNGSVAHINGSTVQGDNYGPSAGAIVNNGNWTEDTSGGTLYYQGNCCGATTSFTNNGTMTHIGAGQTNMYWALNNSGTMNVDAGTLIVRGGGGTATGHAGATYGITGTFDVAGGPDFSILSGNLSGTGTIRTDSGILNVNTNSTSTLPNLTVASGTLNVNGTDSAISLTLSGGTQGGTGALTLTRASSSGNALTWSGGTMTDAGSTVLPSGTSGTIGGYVSLTGRHTLGNNGTVTHTSGSVNGENYPTVGTSGAIVNTGTWTEDTSGGGLSYSGNCCGATMVFTNNGSMSLTGHGSLAIAWNFANNGTLSIDGTLQVSGSYSMSSTSTTNMTIAGTTAGSQYSQVFINAAVTLQGTLNVTTPSTFVPPPGSTYTIIQYATSTTGTFSLTFNGHTYTPNYTSSQLILTA